MRAGALGSTVAIQSYDQPVRRGLETFCAALAQGVEQGTIKTCRQSVRRFGTRHRANRIFPAFVAGGQNPAHPLVDCDQAGGRHDQFDVEVHAAIASVCVLCGICRPRVRRFSAAIARSSSSSVASGSQPVGYSSFEGLMSTYTIQRLQSRPWTTVTPNALYRPDRPGHGHTSPPLPAASHQPPDQIVRGCAQPSPVSEVWPPWGS